MRNQNPVWNIVLDNFKKGVMVLEEDFTVSQINNSGRELLSFSDSLIQNKSIFDLIKFRLEDSSQVLLSNNIAKLSDKAPIKGILDILTGPNKEDSLQFQLMKIEENATVNYILFFKKQLHHPQYVQRDKEHLYHQLMSHVSDGILIADKTGNLIDVNENLALMLGYSKKELLDMKIIDLLDPEDLTRLPYQMQNILTYGGVRFSRKLRKKDGSTLYTEISGNFDDEHQVIYGIIRDIRKRKQMEIELRDSKDQLKERLKELNCLYSVTKIIGEKNSGVAEKMQAIVDIIPISWQYPDITNCKITLDGHVYTTPNFESSEWVQTSKIRTNDEYRGKLEVYYSEKKPTLDEGPFMKEERDLLNNITYEISQYLTSLETKNQLEISRNRLIQEEQVKVVGRLAGLIAHDFNNLLNVISLNASLGNSLVQDSDKELKDIFIEIKETTQKAADLTSQLLAYSGKGVSITKSLDLNEFVREMEPLIKLSIPDTLDLSIKLTVHPLMGNFDPKLLEQVILNLVLNSAEAVDPDTGVISIETGVREVSPGDDLQGVVISPEDLRGRYLSCSIKDNGKGIDPVNVEKIFDLFYTTKFTGRGMGLSVVKKIVFEHNGGIIINTELDEGSEFMILFPTDREKLDNEDDLSNKKEEDMTTETAGTVLICDDEPTIRTILSKMIGRMGYDVVGASNGQEGLEQFQSNMDKIILAMIDLTMPVLDGKAAIKEIRKLKDTPIIIMTGYSEYEIDEMLSSYDKVTFLQKPFSMAQVEESIQVILNETR